MEIKDKRFWVLLIGGMIAVMIIRTPSPPIRLPEAAHNTIGDLPILEQADDGYVSSVEEKPKWFNARKSKQGRKNAHFSGSVVSMYNFTFNSGSYSRSVFYTGASDLD